MSPLKIFEEIQLEMEYTVLNRFIEIDTNIQQDNNNLLGR